MPWCYWSNCWNPWNRFSVRVFVVFSALSNLFSLHWRWRATHHTPLQEFTRRLPFCFYAFDLLALGINAEARIWATGNPCGPSLMEFLSCTMEAWHIQQLFDYHQTALVANLWYVHLALSQGDNSPMNLVLFNDALVMLIDWDIIWFSNANDNETKCLQHVMATPLVNLEAHLLRLHRIIRLTRGMALLIGVGGSGIVAAMRISRPFAFDAAFWDWSNVHSVSQPSKYSCI